MSTNVEEVATWLANASGYISDDKLREVLKHHDPFDLLCALVRTKRRSEPHDVTLLLHGLKKKITPDVTLDDDRMKEIARIISHE